MKCPVCNYSNKEFELDEEKLEYVDVSSGTEEFYEIQGTFFWNDKSLYYDVYNNIKVVRLYGCPNCSAVQFKLD